MILHCEFSIYSIIFIHKLTKDYNLSVRIIFVANMLLEISSYRSLNRTNWFQLDSISDRHCHDHTKENTWQYF